MTGISTGVLKQHQCQQPKHLRVIWHQFSQHTSQSDRLGREVAPNNIVTAAGRIAFVKDQVNHRQHAVQPVGKNAVVWHPVRDAGVFDLAFRSNQALGHSGLRYQKRLADLRGCEATQRTERQCHSGFNIQCGMAASEDQPEPIVVQPRVVHPFQHRGFIFL